MTLLETAPARPVGVRAQPGLRPGGRIGAPARGAGRPARPRPTGVRLHYRGTGAVVQPRGPRRQRPGPAVTASVALLAALITVWLGLIAQLGAAVSGHSAQAPDRLGVVRIEPGETLQQLAARVAPGGSATQVSDRIRELNGLEAAEPGTGQTLIAPIG